jgi:hypothetical protein
MAFGRWLLAERAVTYRWALPIGAASVALFLALRLAGGAPAPPQR